LLKSTTLKKKIAFYLLYMLIIFIVFRVGNAVLSIWTVPVQNKVAISQLNGDGTNYAATTTVNRVLVRIQNGWPLICILAGVWVTGSFLYRLINQKGGEEDDEKN